MCGMENREIILQDFDEMIILFKKVGIGLTNHLFIYEEPAEFIKELTKYLRGNSNEELIAEEGIDTIIAFSVYLKLFYNKNILENILTYKKKDLNTIANKDTVDILGILPKLMSHFPTISIIKEEGDNIDCIVKIIESQLIDIWLYISKMALKDGFDLEYIFGRKIYNNIRRMRKYLA